MKQLTYEIKENEFKGLGYTFQKMYAADYKCYHKKLKSGIRIWCWVKGKTIEVNDWFHNSEALIKFYIENKNHPDFEEKSFMTGKAKDYIKVQLNPENGFVQLHDEKEYFKVFDKSRNLPKNRIGEAWKDWNDKYENWHNDISIHRESFDELIKEIKNLKPSWDLSV